jgi:hypothetical protein
LSSIRAGIGVDPHLSAVGYHAQGNIQGMQATMFLASAVRDRSIGWGLMIPLFA